MSDAGAARPTRAGAGGDGLALGILALAGAAAALLSARLLPAVGAHLSGAGAFTVHLGAFVWAGGLALTLLLWPVPDHERPHLLAAWAIKVLVTIGFMLAYEARYPFVDGYGYYRQASMMTGFAPWGFGDGTALVESLVFAHLAFLPDGYQLVKVSFSFVGFAGLYLAFRAAALVTGRRRVATLYLFLLFPSLVFWTSILGKDPLALFGISLYAFGVAVWWREGRRRGLFWAVVGILVAAAVRLWLGPILLVPILYLVARKASRVSGALVAAGTIAGAWWLVGVLTSRFGIAGSEDAIAFLSRWSQAWARGGSAQTLEPFRDLGDLLAFLPIGMFTALFRPLPGEIGHAFGLLAGAENAVLLALAVLAIARGGRTLRDPLVGWALLVVLAWSAVYAFLSYQNLGTGARFRVQILPLLLALILVGLGSRAGDDGRSARREPTKEVGVT